MSIHNYAMLAWRDGMATAATAAEHHVTSKAPIVLGATITMTSLAVLVVAVRIYSRTCLTKYRGTDDWYTVGALFFSCADQALRIIWCRHGLGMHFKDVSKHDLMISKKCAYAIQILYPWSLGLVKISILIFYLRVFPHQTFRRVCYVALVIVAFYTISASLAQAFICHPIARAYNGSFAGHCNNKIALQYTASIFNLTSDFAVLLMPMKYLWALSLEGNKRLQTIAMFSLGLLTCVASAGRLTTIHSFYTGSDPTRDAWPISICSGLELNLTIITASLPAVKPLMVLYIWRPLRALFPRSESEMGNQSPGQSPGYESADTTHLGSVSVKSPAETFTHGYFDDMYGNDAIWGKNFGPRGGNEFPQEVSQQTSTQDLAYTPPHGRQVVMIGHMSTRRNDIEEFSEDESWV